MANELPNAVALMREADFRDWLVAAGAYTARTVLNEDEGTPYHRARLLLAYDVLGNPAMIAERLVTIVATDPEVAGKGNGVAAVGQPLILAKVAAAWTALARMAYPMEPR